MSSSGTSTPSPRNKLVTIAIRLAVLALVGSGVFVFQNCSMPASGLSESDSEQATADKMAFSYDTTLDQIAYMSCPLLTTGFDTDTYFSFRAGAYRTGGIMFNDAFYSTYGKKSSDMIAQLVSQSTANSSTVAQLAIRQTANLNSIVNGGGTPVLGSDYYNMLDTLGSIAMTESLVAAGYNTTTNTPTETRTRYLRNGTEAGLHMEGSLNLGTSEALAASVRNTYLSTGQSVLAVTYVEPSSANATNARSPQTAFPTTQTSTSAQAYGIGYRIGFVQPTENGRSAVGLLGVNATTGATTGVQTTPYPTNIMNSVQEISLLSSSSAAASWVCPTDLRFKIVRSSLDVLASGTAPAVGGIACVRAPDPAVVSGDLAIARNSLRVEDWYIDMTNHCIMPKNDVAPNCYGSLNYVNYDFTNQSIGCDPNSTGSGSSTTTTTTTGTTTSSGGSNALNSPVCMAWVSICYRQN